jgi:Glycosyltransferase family 87
MRALAWYIGTRVLGLLPFLWPEAVLLREPTKWLVDLDRLGPLRALPEYPWPTALLAYLPMALGIPTIVHYYAAVVLFALGLDALVAWGLWRAGGRTLSRGLWLWLLLFPALGPLVVTRLDLVPAALAAASLIALSRQRAAGSGALAALGAGFKLWPALALPGLLLAGEHRQRARVLLGFALCAAALAAVTLAAAGGERLGSPLRVQSERGLQIEAFAALPFLWARFLASGAPWDVAHQALCNCDEISGPAIAGAMAAARLAALAAAAALAALYVRALRAPPAARGAATAALLTALALLAWLVTSRVFSPQYLLWLAAPLAVLGVLPGAALEPADVALFVLACLLSHLVFPIGYEALLVERHFLQGPVLSVLTARDALLVALGVRLAARGWRMTAP